MPSNQNYFGFLGSSDLRIKLGRIEATEDNSIRVGGDGAVQQLCLFAGLTGTVDDVELPAQQAAGGFKAAIDTDDATVLEVLGDKDDALASLRLGPGHGVAGLFRRGAWQK